MVGMGDLLAAPEYGRLGIFCQETAFFAKPGCALAVGVTGAKGISLFFIEQMGPPGALTPD
jgi:hypothetical protein